MNGHGHACPMCGGVGTVRVRGLPGYQRVACARCGGTGLLRPGRNER